MYLFNNHMNKQGCMLKTKEGTYVYVYYSQYKEYYERKKKEEFERIEKVKIRGITG